MLRNKSRRKQESAYTQGTTGSELCKNLTMVFCCGPLEDLTPEERYVVGNKTENNAVSHQRNFIPTNGNALIAGSPPTNLGREGEDLVSGKTKCNWRHIYLMFASSETIPSS